MGAPLKTTVSELPDSRVRVDVQVAPEEIDARLQSTARRLGRQLKLPGFRRGKVPPPLVLQRLGREAVLDETVRDTLPAWYAEAIRASRIVPVGDPSIDLGELPAGGGELTFTIEIGVLPKARLGEYLGLEVGRRDVEVTDAEIDHELEGVRERFARLETVTRAAGAGDYVVVDYLGRLIGEDGEPASEPFAGGEGRDQLVELGSGNLIPGFEEGLAGMSAGEERTVRVRFPDDYGAGAPAGSASGGSAAELAGREAAFAVTVKEVKAKELPALDDDLAVDAGFEDLAELRRDIATRLREAREGEAQSEFREAVLDAAVAHARVPVTEELATARAHEMWERMLHSLSHRGISREAYLRIAGREEAEILTEMRPEAEQALAREAVLTAIVAAESIEPSEEDLLQALTPVAEREGISPEEALRRLRASDRVDELREDLAARQALELIVERAVAIPAERAAAREKLWTPETEKDADAARAHTGAHARTGAGTRTRTGTGTGTDADSEAGESGGGEKLWTPSGSGGAG